MKLVIVTSEGEHPNKKDKVRIILNVKRVTPRFKDGLPTGFEVETGKEITWVTMEEFHKLNGFELIESNKTSIYEE